MLLSDLPHAEQNARPSMIRQWWPLNSSGQRLGAGLYTWPRRMWSGTLPWHWLPPLQRVCSSCAQRLPLLRGFPGPLQAKRSGRECCSCISLASG